MAKEVSTEKVMAWGRNGLKLTPVADVAWIEEIPLGPHNQVIPATLRLLCFKPMRIVGIRRAGRDWPVILLRDAGGQVRSCCVMSSQQAQDSIFDSLPAPSRARISALVSP